MGVKKTGAELPNVIDTGLANVTCCQPEALSLENVAEASNAPLALHNAPTCVPVFACAL